MKDVRDLGPGIRRGDRNI